MGRIIYLMNVSLDGFVEGPDGKFDWTWPDEEVFRFHTDLAREAGAFVYGRRIYESMRPWETMGDAPGTSPAFVEYARIWKAKPKLVFSTTLREVGAGMRLATGDLRAEVATLRAQHGGDLAVCGPGLAASFAKLGLIEEYRLVVYPYVAGGGKRYWPAMDQALALRLVETKTFGCGAVYLRYEKSATSAPIEHKVAPTTDAR